jgi:hypothetical protein
MGRRHNSRRKPGAAGIRLILIEMHRLHLTLRELSRLQAAAPAERRPWEPGGSASDD